MKAISDLLFNGSPAMMHAAMVHGPVVLTMLAFCGLVLCVILPGNKTLRWMAFGIHFLLLVAVCLTVVTGENAVARVPSEYDAAVWEQIESHEEWAENFRIVVAVVFVITALAFVSGQRRGRHLIWLALLGSAVSLGMVITVAHKGGTLVYGLGVGTPSPPSLNATQPAPTPAPILPLPAPEAPDVVERAETIIEPPVVLNFATDIQPIFNQHCTECHEADDPSSGLDLTSLAGALKGGQKAGPAIVAGDPDASPLVQYLEGTRQPQMPKRAPALDTPTIQTLRDWIAAGAQ